MLRNHRSAGILCDVELLVGDEKIMAHKIMITVWASPDIDPAALRDLVMHAYGDNLVVSKENIQNIIVAANFLQMHDIAEKCATYLFEHLTNEANALTVSRLFTAIGCSVAMKVEQYIKKDFRSIVMCEEFLELSLEELTQILSWDDLCTTSEQDTFDAAIRWIEHDPERTTAAARYE
ncbi:BTB/POZ domain protein [Ancylostoma ceylanicum]|uniref:BTB/POZ domain protein n=2 Tax=Ancylostoma ceylanicum TaxID=53326 RepID=A0A0D6LCY9_9BILA|nr:BTB/POZ domain protein [Ancylostoma ceylanicum]EYB84422.1 hypothetical protein Y032_0317g2334 [Ancylostoma ceylanicum]